MMCVLLLYCCNMLVWFWPLYQHTFFSTALEAFVKLILTSHGALINASKNFKELV